MNVGSGPYPAESVLSTALARFIGAHPRVRVRLEVRDWDELARRLRARELDFLVAEISTLQQEHDVAIEPLAEHPLFFTARHGHPLAGRGEVSATDVFAFPFASPARIPPRILEPMLAAQRRAPDKAAAARAFPSLECNAISAIKRVVQGSDAITAVTLSSIVRELQERQLTLLGSAPWLHVRYVQAPTFDQLTEQQFVGQRPTNRVLDQTLHRPRAHQRIETLLGRVQAQCVGESDLDLLLGQLALELEQELVDEAQNDVLVQRLEAHHGVQPVAELGREQPLDVGHLVALRARHPGEPEPGGELALVHHAFTDQVGISV